MSTTIEKWGKSLAVKIPQAVARRIHIQAGDAVDLVVTTRTILVRPAGTVQKISALLRRITPANRHDETDFGKANETNPARPKFRPQPRRAACLSYPDKIEMSEEAEQNPRAFLRRKLHEKHHR